MPIHRRNGTLEFGQDAVQQRAGQRASAGKHHLHFDVRRRSLNTIKSRHIRDDLVPRDRLGQRLDCRVSGQAEQTLAQLSLESVHHRQHDDQRRDAQCDADDGRGTDERCELVRALRAQVAQPDEGRHGTHHRRISATQ